MPEEFLEDVYQILGELFSAAQEGGIETDAKDDIYKVVPREYLDNVSPVDEKGEKLMSLSDLNKAMKAPESGTCKLNNNEMVDFERDKFEANYIHDNYPIYFSLENAWRMLEAGA